MKHRVDAGMYLMCCSCMMTDTEDVCHARF